MKPSQIPDAAALEKALGRPLFLLFKHSRTCPISARAFARYASFLEGHGDLESGWLEVVAQRSLARSVEERTGIRHESPQAILFRHGRALWHASHGAITPERLEAAISGEAQSET